MAYKFSTLIASVFNFGSKRSESDIEYAVLHYTGNDGDTDENNAKYFKNNKVYASAHYFADSNSITQSVLDTRIAYSVGGSKYPNCNKTGGGKFYGKCTNANSINIELCDDHRDGKIYPSQATIDNAIELTKKLMKKYNIPAKNVIRHFDVTGKSCPAFWTDDEKWEKEFHSKLTEAQPDKNKKNEKVITYRVRKSWDNPKSQLGAYKNLDNAIKKCNTKSGYKVYDELGCVVYKPTSQYTKKTNKEIAKEVIDGKWGNGATRKKKLQAAGYDYNAVQKEVNKLLK